MAGLILLLLITTIVGVIATVKNDRKKQRLAILTAFASDARVAIAEGSAAALTRLRAAHDNLGPDKLDTANQIIINVWRSLFLAHPYTDCDFFDKVDTAKLEIFGIERKAFYNDEIANRYLESIAFKDLVTGGNVYPVGSSRGNEINLEDGEKVVFPLDDVQLMKEVTHRHYHSTYVGTSTRLAKGLSARAGCSEGETVIDKAREVVDHGRLYVTNRAVTFTGKSITKRIPLRKILQLVRYSDGLEVAENGKPPLIFLVPNPAFLEDIVGRLIHPA